MAVAVVDRTLAVFGAVELLDVERHYLAALTVIGEAVEWLKQSPR